MTQRKSRIVLKEKLNSIRKPETLPRRRAVIVTCAVFFCGIGLGVFAKWLDNLVFDGGVWWRRAVEAADLGNFFSEPAVWLLSALVIAVFSRSALRAALNVFVFFAGMCAAYHLYTVLFSGFDPASYMLIWYGITLVSPVLAALCWYAKGEGYVSVLLNVCIMAVLTLACFSVGFVYVGFRGVTYLLVYLGAAAALYKNPKRLLTVPAGFLLAFPLSFLWPYR